MSEELVLLKEYFDGLGVGRDDFTMRHLSLLRSELKQAGESGLADMVARFSSPTELFDYIGEEE